MSAPANHPPSSRLGLWLGVGWAIILVKCLLTPWVIARWQVPIHPGWVIVPTLILAVVITAIVLARRRNHEV